MRKEFLLILIFVVGAVFLAGCTQPNPPIPPGGNGLENPVGTLLLAVKDKALDNALLDSVKLTVSEVSIHSPSCETEECSAGWIVLSSTPKEYSLLELQDVQALLASKDLNARTYNQIRLSVEKVLVDYNGTEQEAKLPSNELKINVQIQIDANKTSIAVLDFDLNKSLHITGNGKIIMLPVIRIVAEKNVQARIEEENRVRIENHGTETEDSETGTDIEGNNGQGKQVGHDKELEIGDDGKIKEKQNQGNGNGSETEGANVPKGRLIGTIKDKKPLTLGKLDISGLKELNLTISSITIHRPNSSDQNAKSWTELFSGEKTWNLLAFQNTEALLADINVAIGSFTQIRLKIEKAIAVFDQNSDQNGATYTVKVPSRKLRLTSKIIVDENKTSYFNLDFDLGKSLHITGSDKIILKPVIRLLAKRHIRIRERQGNKITAENGTEDQNSTTEFDENGEESA